MAFQIPNLKATVQRARNAFRAEASGTDAWLWPNNVAVTAKVFGGIAYMIFQRLAWIDRQRFVYTCDDDTELAKHGMEWGIGRKQPSFAQGFVAVPASYPFTVPANTIFRRSDGVAFASTNSVSAIQYGSATLIVPVVCQTAGKIGNTIAGAPLTTSLSGPSGAALAPTVADTGIGQGADLESFESYKERLLARKRQPPMGGAEHDYIAWAKEVPGVSRVFVRGNAFGGGTVGVWFLMDDAYPFGIPQPIDVTAVQDHLDALAPATATVIVQAPVADCIDIVVQGLSPDTAQIRQSVAGEILALFKHMTQPGLPDQPFVLRHSWLQQAVSNATGEQYNEGVVAPATDVTFAAGVMPCPKSVTFIP